MALQETPAIDHGEGGTALTQDTSTLEGLGGRWCRKTFAAVTLIALAAVLSASAAGSGSASTTLRVRTATWINLDAQVVGASSVTNQWNLGYDRLVALGRNGSVVPYLAKSWDQTANSITFHLRSDAKCPDGSKVTPLVVLNSFNRFLTVTKTLNELPVLFGPGPYHMKADRYRNTFTFSSDTPNRNMLYGFTTAFAGIICPAGLKALSSDPTALQSAEYGSGPYTMTEYVPGDHVTFKKRSNWDWGPPGTNTKLMPETVILQVVSDETTAANLMLTGGLDLSTVTGADAVRMIKAAQSHQVQFRAAKNFQTYGLALNMAPGRPLQNAALRHALFLAIDTKAAAAASWPGTAVWSPSFFVPGGTCYDPKTKDLLAKPSLSAAQQVLTNAGFKYSGNTLLDPSGNPVSLRFIAITVLLPAADLVANAIRSLGINLDYLFSTGATFTQSYLARNFDITTAGLQTGYDAPGVNSLYFSGPIPPAGSNTPAVGYGDTDYANGAAQGLQTIGAESCKHFFTFQELMIKNAYWLPIASPVTDWFASSNVARWLPTGTGYLEPYYVEMKQ
jgi:peptide/nickel transport system substrate-binding protein